MSGKLRRLLCGVDVDLTVSPLRFLMDKMGVGRRWEDGKAGAEGAIASSRPSKAPRSLTG